MLVTPIGSKPCPPGSPERIILVTIIPVFGSDINLLSCQVMHSHKSNR